ncbi:MAG: Flp pilus assembly protein CpaB [Polyangiaceae bacterium]
MNRRNLIGSLLLVVLGIMSLLLFQSTYTNEAAGGEKILVLVASRPIERGKPILDTMITTREVPQAYVEDRAIKDAERNKVLGFPANNAIQEKQTIMWSDVATSAEDRRDLSSLIQPGNRAISVLLTRTETSIALMKPGDFVDLISILPTGDIYSPNSTYGSVVLFQRVLVLACGMDTSTDSVPASAKAKANEPGQDKQLLLTLSLTTPEAQLLALAGERGKIAVALRHPDDLRTADRIPDLPSDVLTDPDRLAQVKGRRMTTAQAFIAQGPASAGVATPAPNGGAVVAPQVPPPAPPQPQGPQRR